MVYTLHVCIVNIRRALLPKVCGKALCIDSSITNAPPQIRRTPHENML